MEFPARLRASCPLRIRIRVRLTPYRLTEASWMALRLPLPRPPLSVRRLPTVRFRRRSRIPVRTARCRKPSRPDPVPANRTMPGIPVGLCLPVPPTHKPSRARRNPRPELFGTRFRAIPRHGTEPLGHPLIRPLPTTFPRVRPLVITLALRDIRGTVPSANPIAPLRPRRSTRIRIRCPRSTTAQRFPRLRS